MRVAGTVAESTVAVLRHAVAQHGVPHHLDLSEVEFVDTDGASTILELETRGAVIVGAQPYTELLLRAPGSPPGAKLQQPK